jgi:hypothetical protein
MERVKFIKDKLGESKGLLNTNEFALKRILDKGGTIEELISHAQRQEGMKDYLGSVNFNKLSSEFYGTGEFGTAGQLSDAERTARSSLAGAFKDSSQVESLLGSDTKERQLFLAAAKGDPDAVKLLTREMSTKDKEGLLSKFGVKEEALGGLQKLFGGAKGDVKGLASNMSQAINRSSLGGLAAQLRRQGNDITRRLESSGLAGPEKELISGFAGKLSDLTSKEKLSEFFSGKGGSEMSYLLDSVSGLRGEAKQKALDALGEGAGAAIGFGESVTRKATRRGGLAELKKSLPEELQRYVDEHAKGGALSAKDAQELGRMARDKTFAGSLAASGEVKKQDVQSSFNREMLDKLNIFAQTTNQFANLVVQATPQLDANVKAAQANVTSAAQGVQSLPDGRTR